MKKIVLTFGLIAGAIMAGTFFLALPFHEQIGFDRGMIVGYTSMILAFMMVFAGIKSYRDNIGGGVISFRRALGVGSLIALVASSVYVAAWEVYFFGAKPDYMEKYAAHVIEKARADGETAEQLAAREAEMAKWAKLYQNPAINAAITFMEPLPPAVIMTLLAAAVLSRKRREDGAPEGAGAPA